MLQGILKLAARLTLFFFANQLTIHGKEKLNVKGPIILACNHPNSFLDSIIIGTYFKPEVYFLARGDVFKGKVVTYLLELLNLLPVYRMREGREHLYKNAATFDASHALLSQGGSILVFSEGLCINEWKLRPLKKGTARIALKAWKDVEIGGKLRVLPVAINYSDFTKIGKRIEIFIGDEIEKSAIDFTELDSLQRQEFNSLLKAQLEPKVLAKKDLQKKNNKSILLLLPAIIGLVSHFIFYLPIQYLTKKVTDKTVHHDSELFVALLVCYPIYYIICLWLALSFLPLWTFFLVLLFPLFGKAALLYYS